MHKIWALKKEQEKQKQQEQQVSSKPQDDSTSSVPSNARKTRTNPALIRVQRDLHEMELPNTIKIHFTRPDDLLDFTLNIIPDEGIYKSGSFDFTFKIPPTYPHDPPKVKCTQKIYHPNIDLQGNVCLNILREDWKPVLSLTAVMIGLLHLFLEPNSDDPLNKDAAEVLRNDRPKFIEYAQRAMSGRAVQGEMYDKVTK